MCFSGKLYDDIIFSLEDKLTVEKQQRVTLQSPSRSFIRSLKRQGACQKSRRSSRDACAHISRFKQIAAIGLCGDTRSLEQFIRSFRLSYLSLYLPNLLSLSHSFWPAPIATTLTPSLSIMMNFWFAN